MGEPACSCMSVATDVIGTTTEAGNLHSTHPHTHIFWPRDAASRNLSLAAFAPVRNDV